MIIRLDRNYVNQATIGFEVTSSMAYNTAIALLNDLQWFIFNNGLNKVELVRVTRIEWYFSIGNRS